ncbi:hypothetical protein MACH05_16010 [Qipengyuania nanhaisediminis]
MSLMLAAATLPLVPIAAGDERLDRRSTFVSANAEIELVESEDRVLCLDRVRASSICLTESEWREAIALAASQPERRRAPQAFFPQRDYHAFGSQQDRFGLASSPSTMRAR